MIDPQDIDPETGKPYSNYSSPSIDTFFHDHEMNTNDLSSSRPKHKTRDTSVEALKAIEKRAPNLRTRIWHVLDKGGPMTPDEVAARLGESPLSVRPQFTKLTKENKIADTGVRRTNESGRQAIVWMALGPEAWQDEPLHLTPQERIELLETENNKMRSAIISLRAENERLRGALRQGADWFEEYAAHHQQLAELGGYHLNKERSKKARRNEERADFLRQALQEQTND